MLGIWAWIHSEIKDGKKDCYAIIFEPDENQGEVDSWHLKELKQKTGKIRRVGKFTDIDTMYKKVKNHPCFVDIIKFPPVPKDIYAKYMELRTKNVMENKNEFIDQKDMAKVICWNIKNNFDKFTDAIKEGRFSKPAYWMIAKILCFDPTRKNQFVGDTTILSWIKEIDKKIKNPKVIESLNKEEVSQEGEFGE